MQQINQGLRDRVEEGNRMDLREIEKTIAEKVMGWRVAYFPTINIYEAYDEEENPIIIGKDFSPARKIQDAWVVVEKLRENFWVQVDVGKGYLCSVGKYGLAGSGILVEANTAPLAICLAALKAVGVEVEVDG